MEDRILEATMEYIRRDPRNLELALRIENAMPQLRQRLCEEVLKAAKEKLGARTQNGEVRGTWEVHPSWTNGNRNFMARFSHLVLRPKGWPPDTAYNGYVSGVQIMTDKSEWGQVWLGIMFPRDFGRQVIQDATLESFQGLQPEGIFGGWYGGEPHQMWRYCSFSNWGDNNFMNAALAHISGKNTEMIAQQIADGLVRLARLVEDKIQAHHQNG